MTAISRQTSLGHITFQQREIQEQAFALARKHLNASNELYGSFEIIGRGSYSVTLLHEDEERSYPVLFQTGRTLFTVNGILHGLPHNRHDLPIKGSQRYDALVLERDLAVLQRTELQRTGSGPESAGMVQHVPVEVAKA